MFNKYLYILTINFIKIMRKNLLLSNRIIQNHYLILLIICFMFNNVEAQLYNNGPLSTSATAANGTAAPTGYTWSETQANTGNTAEANASFGFAAWYNTAATNDFRLADDFVVPVGQTWNITNFAFFCYQTSFAGSAPPINVLRVQIFNGDPAAGGTLVAGNMTTNVYDAANSGEAFMYRISNTSIPIAGPTGTSRKIWRVRANITASLTAGTYWVVYQGHAINDASFFMIPVTIVNSRGGAAANAKQLTVSSGIWANYLDLGIPASAPDVPQDMSFLINDVTLTNNQFEKATALVIYPNPVNVSFEILNTLNVKLTKIEIIDNLGRVIKEIVPAAEQTNFDCADLQAGNYFVKITSANGTETRKIVKN